VLSTKIIPSKIGYPLNTTCGEDEMRRET